MLAAGLHAFLMPPNQYNWRYLVVALRLAGP